MSARVALEVVAWDFCEEAKRNVRGCNMPEGLGEGMEEIYPIVLYELAKMGTERSSMSCDSAYTTKETHFED